MNFIKKLTNKDIEEIPDHDEKNAEFRDSR